MLNAKMRMPAILAGAVFGFYPQAAFAETFKASDFLKWNADSQAFYIEASIGMAGLIAGRNAPAQGQCLEAWYYSDEAGKTAFILDTMRRVPDYHPRGVILAVLEKQCGKIIYTASSN